MQGQSFNLVRPMRETIITIGLVQSLFGVLVFLSKRPRHLCFNLLAVWLFVIAIFLGSQLLPFEVVDYFKPGIFPILFLFGPLLYFYVNSLVVEHFKLRWIHAFHVLPLIIIWVHRSFTDAVSVTSSSNLAENPSYIYNKIYYVLLIISLFLYWILSIRLILSHRKKIPYFFSNYSKNNTLSWLIFVVFIFLFLIVADRFLSSLQKVLGIAVFQFLSISSNLTIFTFIMVFFGINQTVIYKPRRRKTGGKDTDSTLKYKHSSLSNEQKDEISSRVTTYLKTNKPYLIADYSLQMMAEELQM